MKTYIIWTEGEIDGYIATKSWLYFQWLKIKSTVAELQDTRLAGRVCTAEVAGTPDNLQIREFGKRRTYNEKI